MLAMSAADLDTVVVLPYQANELMDHRLGFAMDYKRMGPLELEGTGSVEHVVAGQKKMEPAPELGWNDFLSQVQPGANVVLGDSSLDLVDFCGSDVQDPLPEVGSKQCHVSG